MNSLKIKIGIFALLVVCVLSGCKKDDEIIPQPEEEMEQVILEELEPVDPPMPDRMVSIGAPIGDFKMHFDHFIGGGYRPVYIDFFQHTVGVATDTETEIYFNAIWEENSSNTPYYVYYGLSSAAYQAKFNELVADGFRLDFVDSYVENGSIKYSPIFIKSTGPQWAAYHQIKGSDWQAKFDEMAGKGFRLKTRSAVKFNGKKYMTAIFDKADVGDWISKSSLDENEAQEALEANAEKGRMLVHMDIAQTSSAKFTYGFIFTSEQHDDWYALNKLTEDQLESEIEMAKDKGYKINAIAGYDEPGLINGNEVFNLRFAVSFIKI